jgi:hypothetical protein
MIKYLNDTVLDCQSEEKMLRLLDKLSLDDFWLTFAYLKDRVAVTELQSFSICLRKYSMLGAFDSEIYSAIHYTCVVDASLGPFFDPVYPYWVASDNERPSQMTILFQKKEDVPDHLRTLHALLLQDKDLASQVYRLSSRPKQDFSVDVKDTLLIGILRNIAGSKSMRGTFPLKDA